MSSSAEDFCCLVCNGGFNNNGNVTYLKFTNVIPSKVEELRTQYESKHAFQCKFCQFSSGSVKDLSKHICNGEPQPILDPFKLDCEYCSFSAFNEFSHRIHGYVDHWMCYTCNQAFSTKQLILEHNINVHNLCMMCFKGFTSLKSLRSHFQSQHSFKCFDCSFKTFDCLAFKQHCCLEEHTLWIPRDIDLRELSKLRPNIDRHAYIYGIYSTRNIAPFNVFHDYIKNERQVVVLDENESENLEGQSIEICRRCTEGFQNPIEWLIHELKSHCFCIFCKVEFKYSDKNEIFNHMLIHEIDIRPIEMQYALDVNGNEEWKK